MRRPLRPSIARAVQVVGLAAAVLAFAALAGPTLEVGTDIGDEAAARPLTQTATTSQGAPTGTDPPGDADPPADADPPEEGTTGTAPLVPRDGVGLAGQTDWLEEGATFELHVALGEDADPTDAIVIDLHAPVTSRSQFTETLEGRLLGARRAEFVIPLAELTPAPDGTRRIRLVPDQTDVAGERQLRALPRAGVYPLVVGLRPGSPERDAAPPFTTYLVRTPADGTTPLNVAVVQPVRSDLAIGPDGTTTFDPNELDRLEALASVLASSEETPLTLTPRPETLEALRRLTLAAADPRGAQAEAVLSDLRTAAAGRQVVSGPFVDLSLDALEAAGLGEEVAGQRRRGDDAVDDAIGATTDARTWVEDEGTSPRALRRLAGLGVDHLVVPDDSLSPVQLRLSLTRPFALTAGGQGFELEATSPEPALSARFAAADPVLGAQHLLADLAVLHGDEPGPLRPRGVVVAPPEVVRADPVLLAAVLDGLADSPILTPVTLDTYFDEVDPEGGVDDPLVRDLAPTTDRLGIDAADVEEARRRLAALLGIVEGDVAAAGELTDRTLLAQADGLSPLERRRYLAGVTDGLDDLLGSVRILDGLSFRLPDSEGTIPLTIIRDGSQPLAVRVTLESDKLAFDDAGSAANRVDYDLRLTNENTPLVVPVRVRSPGTFPLLITVTSPDGRVELLRSQVTVRSTAFSGVGVALSAGAGVFLFLWWARHWRTVRRARRLVPIA